MQVIPIAGMVAGNAMVAVGCATNQLGYVFTASSSKSRKLRRATLQYRLRRGLSAIVSAGRIAYPDDRLGKDRYRSLPGMMSG